jgi:hypothetical protein
LPQDDDPAELLLRVLDGSDDDEGSWNRLLARFWQGYPVENLRVLLTSDRSSAVRAGIWIASELSGRAMVVIPEVTQLLGHDDRYVRFFAVETVLASGTMAGAKATARAIETIADGDPAVRWKAMRLLARAYREQLSDAPDELDVELAARVRWLLDPDDISAAMDGEDPVGRLFAAAAAFRDAAENGDRTLLEQAARSNDPEVRSFASDEL